MDTKPLEEIGLTKGEAKVYLALLELGPSTTGQIIKLASVSRSKVYEMLEKLIILGLVSYVIRTNTRYYEATSPKRLTEWLQRRKSELTQHQRKLEKTIPDLLKRQEFRRAPQTSTVYEGLEGVRTIFNLILETMKPGEEYFVIQIEPEAFRKDFIDFIVAYHKRRAKKGIKVRLLASEEIRSAVLREHKGIKGMEFRFTKRPLPTATLIFGDRVFTLIWDPPLGVVIHSKTITNRYKKFFSYLWKTAKK